MTNEQIKDKYSSREAAEMMVVYSQLTKAMDNFEKYYVKMPSTSFIGLKTSKEMIKNREEKINSARLFLDAKSAYLGRVPINVREYLENSTFTSRLRKLEHIFDNKCGQA